MNSTIEDKMKEAREAAMKILDEIDENDVENAHAWADVALKKYLLIMGEKEIVDRYQKVPKWFS